MHKLGGTPSSGDRDICRVIITTCPARGSIMHYAVNNFALFSSGIITVLCKSSETSDTALLMA